MIRKCLASFTLLLVVVSTSVFAQSDELQEKVDYKVNKMQKELNMTDAQAFAIKPIIKAYIVKRDAVLQEVAGEGIVDHVAVKGTLSELKDNEYQQLAKILDEDQMKKLKNKDILMAALNPDSLESQEDDGPSLTADGANFKF